MTRLTWCLMKVIMASGKVNVASWQCYVILLRSHAHLMVLFELWLPCWRQISVLMEVSMAKMYFSTLRSCYIMLTLYILHDND